MTSTTTPLLNSSDTILDMTPDGQYLSYIESNGNDQTLYVLNLNTGQKTQIDTYTSFTYQFQRNGEPDPLFNSQTGFDGGALSPNGEFIFYSTGVTSENIASHPGDTRFFYQEFSSGPPSIDVTPNISTSNPIDLSVLAISNDGLTIVYGFEDSNEFNDADLVVENLLTGSMLTIPVSNVPVGANSIQLTPDGHYLAYPTESGGTLNVLDLQSNTTVSYGGGDGNAAISNDGRYVVYQDPEFEGDGVENLLVHDNDAPSAPDKLVSASAAGIAGNGSSVLGALSGDGRHVVFESNATDLVPGVTDGNMSVYLKDLDTGAISVVAADVSDHDHPSILHTFISDDGSRIIRQDAAGDVTLTQFTPPTLTINAIAGDDYINAAEGLATTISGTSDAIGETVLISVPSTQLTASAVVQADGTWKTIIFTGLLGDGTDSIHAVVTDELTTSIDRPFIIDRTPPADLAITSVAGDDIINAAELTQATITGTVLVADPTGAGTDAGSLKVSIDGGGSKTFVTQPSGSLVSADFSQVFDASGVADGEHTVTLTATDPAGNTATVTKQVLVDTTPPKIAITSVSGDDVVSVAELNSMQAVDGTSDAIGATVTVSVDGAQQDQAVVQADGTWIASVSLANGTQGENLVTAQVEDEAGNPGLASAGVYVDRGFSAQQLSVGSAGQQGGGSGVMFPELDAAGDKLVFTGLNFNLISTATGASGAQVYIKDLTTGSITFATPDPSENAEFASISQDGRYIEFVSNANLDPDDLSGTGNPPGYYLTYTEDLTTNSIYFHNLTDDAFDGTDPDTLDPGITPGYYALGNYPDKTPIQPLPVFPLAIADGGNSLELIDDLEPDQVVQPLVMTTEIRLETSFLDTDGTPFFFSGGYASPDAVPPADNDFGRFVLQEYAPRISADGSVMAFEARFFGEQWDTSGFPPAVTIEPPTLTEIYAGPTPPEDDGGGGAASELASSYPDGTPMPFGAIDPALSADGKFVAFWSWDNDDQPEVYVKNLTTGELDIASSDALGNPGVGNASGTFNAGFNSIAISADGRYVAFTSDAVLTSGDSGTGADLFLKDMQTGAITRVNLPAGTFANDLSTQLTMNADGSYIAFVTSKGLVFADNNTVNDVYGVSVAALGAPPQITISPVTGNDLIDAAEDSAHVTVSGTSDAIGQTVTLYVDGGFLPGVTVGADGTWSTTIDTTGLPDGVHQLRATVAASSGATNTTGDLITLDTIAPTVRLSADKTQLAPDQTATITASFSEGIGNLTPNFLSATGGTLSGLTFIDNHTVSELFTPTSGATAYGVDANPSGFFDYAGNANTTGATLGLSAGEAEGDGLTGQGLSMTPDAGEASVAATFDDDDTAAGAGDLSATIDWGDGTTTAGTVSGGNGAFTVNGLHSYAAPAPVSVTVTLADNPPGTATASVTLSVPAMPVVTAVSSAVNASASVTFTPAQLFSASEAEGFPILSYEVEDESPGPSQGFWVLNGAVLASGQLTPLSAAQLSQLSFVAGASSSTSVADTLEVAASDAAGFGPLTTFTVTAAKFAPGDVAPTVTAASVQKAPGLSLAPSSLFSASVPQGETVTSYEVEDTTPNSGHWMFNGVAEPTNQVIDATVAQLSELSFVTGSSTDTLMVRANDGSQWGSFTNFTVAPPPNAAPPAATSADMVMRRGADGAFEFYDIGTNSILLDGPLGQINPALQVVGVGGFNGADTADLLMRDPTTGVFTLYDVSNNNITGNVSMGQVGPEWTMSGFGDFSGHAGETDMLMRNSNSGAFEVYDIANNAIASYAPMGPVGLEWSVAGFGDFSSRANETDLLMRNSNTSAFEVYDIVNNTITSYGPMGQVGLEWSIAGFGDFSTRANETDMLMRNSSSGAFEVYDISNNTITSYAPMGQVGLEWSIAGFGDFSGNANETDMLMRNSNTGAFALFDISNNTITLATGLGQVGTEWAISGVSATPASAPPSAQLSGTAVDPAGASLGQLTQAMASFAPGASTPGASSPIDQAAMQLTTPTPLAATDQIRQA